MSNYIYLTDNTTWVNPEDIDEIGWKLIHSEQPLTKSERLVLASMFGAYCQLIHCDNKTRNKKCNMIKNELKNKRRNK